MHWRNGILGVLVKRNQTAVKTKTFTILTSNETVVIPK